MTMIDFREVRCGACGHLSEQPVVSSTSTFGLPDLDLRPGEPARATLFADVHECPGCGLCTTDLTKAPPSVLPLLRADTYLAALPGARPDLARRYLRASLLAEARDRPVQAGWLALQGAWACDDKADADGARICRERAARFFRAATAAGARYADDDATEAGLLADILRRTGRHREAISTCLTALPAAEGTAVSVLSHIAALARLGDTACHTVREAVIAVPPPGEQDVQPVPLEIPFLEAVGFASTVHKTQARKGTTVPYLAHLLGVAALVLEDGGRAEDAIAALLHDAVEDGGGAPVLERIRERFGERVAGIVESCSDTTDTPKPPWRARKTSYLAHLREAAPDALRVSLADKLHNARALNRDLRLHGDEVWRRFHPDSDQLWYYRSLAGVFRERCHSPLVDELEREVALLEVRALASALERLVAFHDAGDVAFHSVIVTGDQARNYYVQFCVDEGGLFCEAVHNHYLADEHRIDGDQIAELLALGWQPPEEEGRNFGRTVPLAGELPDLEGVAIDALHTLRSVYRLEAGAPLALETSWKRGRPSTDDMGLEEDLLQ